MTTYLSLKKIRDESRLSQGKTVLNRALIFSMFLLIFSGSFAGLSLAENHKSEDHDSKMSMDPDKHDMDKMKKMDISSCKRTVALTEEAEQQLGGVHYKGKMPMKGSSMKMKMDSKEGMKMKMDSKEGMKMKMDSKEGMKMKMDSKEEGMHQDHDAKAGGAFFMAPNEMHHLEGTYSQDCGFRLFLFNAFTKPIRVDRFKAFIKITGEIAEEEVEFIRFLSPNEKNSVLQVPLMEGLKPPFEIELNLKFPESEKVESFNFEVDEHGKIS